MPHTFFRPLEKFSKSTERNVTESDIIEGEDTESESVESESTGSESIESDESSNSELELEMDGIQNSNPRQDPLYEEFARALRSRNAEAIEKFLINVEDIWSLSFNMVEMAIRYGCDKDIIIILYEGYEKGRSSDNKRRIIELPLHAMAAAGNHTGFEFFYDHIDEENDDGENALHIAALHGSYEMAQDLIEKDFNLDKCAKGCEDATPLHYAVRTGNPRTVRILLRHRCRLTQEEAKHIINSLLLEKIPTEAALRILTLFQKWSSKRGLNCFDDIGKYEAEMNRARDKGRDKLVNTIEAIAGKLKATEANTARLKGHSMISG